ncbi:MAG: FAD:protein FMN transferase [Cocleimonas sp.]|nr:FAD:protein FMN transferase [Cocleimonas sp.]
MGTQYHISVIPSSNKKPINQPALKKEIDALLVEVNRQMSTYDPNSEISQFNQYQQTDWFNVSKDFALVVSSAQSVSKDTQGAFDITVARLIDLWGFGAKTKFKLPTEQQIKSVLKNTGHELLEVRTSPPAIRKLNKNIRIDLSAIAKGFAVDKITEYLNGEGYLDYSVEIGGEVRNQGFNSKGKPWKIGVEKPQYSDWIINEVLLSSNLAVATSGDYRNYFIKDGVRYSHTINPMTGKPVRHNLAAVTVLHESTMMADAYATALMVLGERQGKAFSEHNKLRVGMIIRKGESYEAWENINKTKIPQSLQRCVKVGGCAYIE